MQGEQAHPACGMDSVLVWMMPRFSDLGRNIMDLTIP